MTSSMTASGRREAMRRGAWQLDARRPVRLRPREDVILRAGHGRLWITFEHAQPGVRRPCADRILAPSQRLAVRGGQTVIVGAVGAAHASFDWESPTPALPAWWQALLQLCACFAPPLIAAR